jgi:hypothetical protein
MFAKLKTILARKRIKQVGDKFVPQVLRVYGWAGLEIKNNGCVYLAVTDEYQLDHCAVPTVADAEEVFQQYYEWTHPVVFAAPKKKSKDNLVD